jgi:hypothetical protein
VTRRPDPRAADRALRRVAQLRALFRRLPHLPTPEEERLLREFEAYASGAPGPCTSEALRAGFLRAFRADAPAAILAAARRAGPVVDEERDLWPYEAWAERRSARSH